MQLKFFFFLKKHCPYYLTLIQLQLEQSILSNGCKSLISLAASSEKQEVLSLLRDGTKGTIIDKTRLLAFASVTTASVSTSSSDSAAVKALFDELDAVRAEHKFEKRRSCFSSICYIYLLTFILLFLGLFSGLSSISKSSKRRGNSACKEN